MAKIVMSWNINKDDESTYFEFIVQEFLPELMKLGMRPTQAWYTIFGDGPQIISTAEPVNAEDAAALRDILAGEEWGKLMARLDRYVTDYRQRIVR